MKSYIESPLCNKKLVFFLQVLKSWSIHSPLQHEAKLYHTVYFLS